MATITKVETHTVTGTDVREVGEAIWQEILDIHHFYGRNFPYDMQKLRMDIGQILLWDMAEKLVVQFYDHEKIERLAYEFIPQADPGAVHSAPGEFPRFEIAPSWQVRLIARYTTKKPEHEVAEFYRELGWRPCEPLIRTGAGTTERYGSFRSGNFGVNREVYKDIYDQPRNSVGREV